MSSSPCRNGYFTYDI
nr:unnamed protein product [Callosobruchus analis]CAI5839424.1 unnamed protein product [Callosobruchus analis]